MDSIIVSRMNTPEMVGAAGCVDQDYPNLLLPDRLWRVTVRKNVSSKWLYYLIVSDGIRAKLREAATGTSGSMKNLSKNSFRAIAVFLPPTHEQRAIADILASVDNLIEAFQSELNHLNLLKKGLIHQLLTGTIRVPVS